MTDASTERAIGRAWLQYLDGGSLPSVLARMKRAFEKSAAELERIAGTFESVQRAMRAKKDGRGKKQRQKGDKAA